MRTIEDLAIDGRRLLVRVDFNVTLEDGRIRDDQRIRSALPTLRTALDRGASLSLMSHLGRPGGERDPELSLGVVADRLTALLDGVDVELRSPASESASFEPRTVRLLENLRYDPGEKAGDDRFARQLASWGDVYVNDAFGACHRSDASMVAVPRCFRREDRGVGLLVAHEVRGIDRILDEARSPFVVVMGGAKVSDKIDVIGSLLERADRVLLGGALAYTFLAARGDAVGASKVEPDKMRAATDVLERFGDRVLLPRDHRVGDPEDPERDARVVAGDIPAGAAGYDIGPRTIEQYTSVLEDAHTLVWNGPLGVFESERFAVGTRALVDAAARDGLTSLVGGGETGDAVARAGKTDAITHLSTGGGAFLHYLQHRSLPALEVLDED